VARGSLLNRFGKDLQSILVPVFIYVSDELSVIDGFIADDFGRALKLGLSAVITFITITFVGGLPFLCAASVLGLVYYLRKAVEISFFAHATHLQFYGSF
jgi:hypothetical protein